VTNGGNVTLHNIVVTDPALTVTGSIASLAVSEDDATTITGTHLITQADIDAGTSTNTPTVAANAGTPAGFVINDTDDEIVSLPQVISLQFVKEGTWADDGARLALPRWVRPLTTHLRSSTRGM
jgi:hypothetical protein